VIIQPVNDNVPELTVESSDECTVEPSPIDLARQFFENLPVSRKKRGKENSFVGPKTKVNKHLSY
jgi:hypothetical protein